MSCDIQEFGSFLQKKLKNKEFWCFFAIVLMDLSFWISLMSLGCFYSFLKVLIGFVQVVFCDNCCSHFFSSLCL